jgi:hypothetical protein
MCMSTVLDIGSFEASLLSKGYFLGENKLDRVLTSLLHLSDARSATGKRVSSMVDFEGDGYLINRPNFEKKISKYACKSVRHRFKREIAAKDFNAVKFARQNGVRLDTINGEFPLRFSNPRLTLHSLKLSHALTLTMRMFKVGDVKSHQRKRGGRIFLESSNLLTSIFLNIFSQLRKLMLSEVALIKCMKNSLCLFVSTVMDQKELPEGDSISLFPPEVWKELKDRLSKDDLVRFCFSCLQSKVLCEEVPEDFILDTLIKHKQQLSSPHRGLDRETLRKLRLKGQEFGVHVAKYYKANKGSFPTQKASFAFPRKTGGVKGDLVYHDRLKDFSNREDPEDRMEPFVIGLFGQPGMGKSVRIHEIVNELSSLFPGVNATNLTYQRTSHVDHWDGYCGQPIVILDDLGQSMDGSDIKEFQTLVSCCPYVLPMAHLDEKGLKFSSPIVIATSNLSYGSNLKDVYTTNNPIIDDASFWRRFHFPICLEFGEAYVLRAKPNWIRPLNLAIERKSIKLPLQRDMQKLSSNKFFQQKMDWDCEGHSVKWKPLDSFGDLRKIYRERCEHHGNIRKNWIQTVVDKCQDTSVLHPLLEDLEEFGFTESIGYKAGTGVTKCLSFPAYPPIGPLPVRIEPITEPLKVRIITAGIGDTFCLKPLQRAMWHALGDFPQFCLTHGTNRLESAIEQIHERSVPGDVWISGDYSAATDSFSIEGSKALLEGILESIDHEPTKRWAMKEISPHLLVYPKNSGLEPVLQESGQLMGSLLSFPLLCLLNDCTAQFSGVSPEKYLINGDDILMRAQPGVYDVWKDVVQDFGLDLSPGKNYIHPKYGTVNSQLVIDSRIVVAGKQNVLDRRSRILGECLRDLEIAMSDTPTDEVLDLFKSVNRQKLSRTVRDLTVPVSHGGLSFSWGSQSNKSKKSCRTAQLCYLNDLFRKIKPLRGCISIPYLSIKQKNVSSANEEEAIFNEPALNTEYHEDFLSSVDLQMVQKRCMTHAGLRDILLAQPIQTLPALNFLHTYQVPCTDHQVKKSLQVAIDSLFLKNFLQGGQDFGYDTFREEFLLTTLNLESNSKTTVTHLVGLMDLDVRPDFLKYVNLDFDPRAFSMDSFEKNLGAALRPKQFDLPSENLDYTDFSLEVVGAYQRQLLHEEIGSLGDIIQAVNRTEEEYLEFPDFGNDEDDLFRPWSSIRR